MTTPMLPVRRTMPGGTTAALGCIVLFLLPFAAAGVFAAAQALRAARSSDWGQAGFLTIFVLVFGGVGFGGLTAVALGWRRVAEAEEREARHPDAAWLWRADWASGLITDSSRTEMWTAWVFAALWNLVSVPSAV